MGIEETFRKVLGYALILLIIFFTVIDFWTEATRIGNVRLWILVVLVIGLLDAVSDRIIDAIDTKL